MHEILTFLIWKMHLKWFSKSISIHYFEITTQDMKV